MPNADYQRLVGLIADLTNAIFEGIRSRQHDDRKKFAVLEEVLDIVKANQASLRERARRDRDRTEDKDDETSFWIHLKPDSAAKIIPWFIAIATAVGTLIAKYHGG